MIKTFLKNNSFLFGIYLLFLGVMAYIFIYANKQAVHIQINQYVGNKFIDNFFFYITYLGDGVLGVIILAIAFMINVRLGIYLTLSFILAALTTNLLKYQFFQNSDRPYWIYQYIDRYDVKKVEGVELLIKKSFPSGHATQAFAIFFGWALASMKQSKKMLFLTIALLTAFSRVYLSQHWLQDITAGSIIGVFYAIVVYLILFYKPSLEHLNKPLMHLFKR